MSNSKRRNKMFRLFQIQKIMAKEITLSNFDEVVL